MLMDLWKHIWELSSWLLQNILAEKKDIPVNFWLCYVIDWLSCMNAYEYAVKDKLAFFKHVGLFECRASVGLILK